MLYRKENRNIYLAMSVILAFLIFMVISGAMSMHHINNNSSVSLQDKRAR